MANGIDAALDDVEAVPPHALLDRPPADPKAEQLPPRNHSMLPTRKVRYRPIRVGRREEGTRSEFAPYGVVNAALVPHPAEGEGSGRALGARFVPKPSIKGDQKGGLAWRRRW
jgi:hypothetical protein